MAERPSAPQVVVLDLPPTVNVYYRHTKRGVLLSATGREYKKAVEEDWVHGEFKKQEGRIRIDVSLHHSYSRPWDIDNRLKPLLDALEGLAYDNDSQIDYITVRRAERLKRRGTEYAVVSIERIDEGSVGKREDEGSADAEGEVRAREAV